MDMENLEEGLYFPNTLFRSQQYSGRPNMLFQTQESHSHAHEVSSVTAAAYYDSRVPSDRTEEALASRNVALERNRREKLNQKLCQLRAAVPTISKMNKASTIKDAIEYIQSLLEQERIIQAEISALENGNTSNDQNFDFDQDAATFCHRPNTPTIMDQYCSNSATIISSPIEVRELRVLSMGEKTVVVTLECNKGTDTIIKLCEVFESLKLKITTANITAFPGRLVKTVFLEADDEERKVVRAKIEAAIAALNYPHSPMSTSKY